MDFPDYVAGEGGHHEPFAVQDYVPGSILENAFWKTACEKMSKVKFSKAERRQAVEEIFAKFSKRIGARMPPTLRDKPLGSKELEDAKKKWGVYTYEDAFKKVAEQVNTYCTEKQAIEAKLVENAQRAGGVLDNPAGKPISDKLSTNKLTQAIRRSKNANLNGSSA